MPFPDSGNRLVLPVQGRGNSGFFFERTAEVEDVLISAFLRNGGDGTVGFLMEFFYQLVGGKRDKLCRIFQGEIFPVVTVEIVENRLNLRRKEKTAGTAAALCVKEQVAPKQLDTGLLQKTLIAQGVYLPSEDREDLKNRRS